MQKYNTSPPHFFRKALTKRWWCVIIVKRARAGAKNNLQFSIFNFQFATFEV